MVSCATIRVTEIPLTGIKYISESNQGCCKKMNEKEEEFPHDNYTFDRYTD